MSTTTDDIEVVADDIEVAAKPRSVNTLINLGTYQGMTDAEIELVLEWRIQMAKTSAISESELIEFSRAMNEVVEGNRASNESLLDMTKKILAAQPIMQTIESEV